MPDAIQIADLDGNEEEEQQSTSEAPPPGIGISILSNMAGFENIMDLNLELKLSLLDDDEFDLGPESSSD